jgi:hypothetical protein
MVIAAMPDATSPPVVRTMVVLEASATGLEVAVKLLTVLVMELTVPKK